MKNRKSFRSNIFLILILFLTIGFSYVTSTLVMSGSISYKKNIHYVFFSNIENESMSLGSGRIVSSANMNSNDCIDFSIEVNSNSSFEYTFEFILNNNSDKKVDISNTDIIGLTVEQRSKISYSIEFLDGIESDLNYVGFWGNVNSIVQKKSAERMKVTIRDNGNYFSSATVLNLSLQLDYSIASEESQARAYSLDELIIKKSLSFGDDYLVSTPDEIKGPVAINLPPTDQTAAMISYKYVGGNPDNYIVMGSKNSSDVYRILSFEGDSVNLLYNDYVGPYSRLVNGDGDVFDNALDDLNSHFDYKFYYPCFDKYKKIYNGYGVLLSSFAGGLTYQFYQYERSGNLFETREIGLLYPSDVLFANKYSPYFDIQSSNTISQDYKRYNWIVNTDHNDLEFLYSRCDNYDGVCLDGFFTLNPFKQINGAYQFSEPLFVRPVVFIESDVTIIDGIGTREDPYVIEYLPC